MNYITKTHKGYSISLEKPIVTSRLFIPECTQPLVEVELRSFVRLLSFEEFDSLSKQDREAIEKQSTDIHEL